MPFIPNYEEFPYCPQDEDLPACVPACVAMVLEWLEIPREWDEICTELNFYHETGTDFRHVRYLAGTRNIYVNSFDEVEIYISTVQPSPVIAQLLVRRVELLGYFLDSDPPLNAVVIVGLDGSQVSFYDPLSHAQRSTTSVLCCPIAVFEDAFIDGWAISAT